MCGHVLIQTQVLMQNLDLITVLGRKVTLLLIIHLPASLLSYGARMVDVNTYPLSCLLLLICIKAN